MGFSPPVIPTVSSLGVAQSTWANLVKEGFDWHESSDKTDSRPYAVLRASAAQSLTQGTGAAISFDTEVADVGNGHSNPSATYTVPTAGLWQFGAVATFQPYATAAADLAYIMANGVTIAADRRPSSTTAATIMNLNGLVVCSAGDVVQLMQLWTGSAGSRTTDVGTVLPALFCYRLNS